MAKIASTTRLVESHQARLPQGQLFLTLMPPDGSECGYEPSDLFGEGDYRASSFVSGQADAYAGYLTLDKWRDDLSDEKYVEEIIGRIADTHSTFAIEALRGCIEATAFSAMCMHCVSRAGEGVARYANGRLIPGTQDRSLEDQIVCRYLDGVAARRGLPMASRNRPRP